VVAPIALIDFMAYLIYTETIQITFHETGDTLERHGHNIQAVTLSFHGGKKRG
jgi:hypothetical protein